VATGALMVAPVNKVADASWGPSLLNRGRAFVECAFGLKDDFAAGFSFA
jgi:hypothetical protein